LHFHLNMKLEQIYVIVNFLGLLGIKKYSHESINKVCIWISKRNLSYLVAINNVAKKEVEQ
jgi:hypothetical protein